MPYCTQSNSLAFILHTCAANAARTPDPTYNTPHSFLTLRHCINSSVKQVAVPETKWGPGARGIAAKWLVVLPGCSNYRRVAAIHHLYTLCLRKGMEGFARTGRTAGRGNTHHSLSET